MALTVTFTGPTAISNCLVIPPAVMPPTLPISVTRLAQCVVLPVVRKFALTKSIGSIINHIPLPNMPYLPYLRINLALFAAPYNGGGKVNANPVGQIWP